MSTPDLLEALLFAADRPLSVEALAGACGLDRAEIESGLEALALEKSSVGALQVVPVAGGWQLVTKPAFARAIRALRDEKKARLSRAAFEVLAIIAYRQPVTRAEIDHLRGVESHGPLGFLLERKIVAPAGRKDAPGRPWMFVTTPLFLESFGLVSLDDLPALSEFEALDSSALDGVGAHPRTLDLFARGEV